MGEHLGELQQLVMAALLRLGPEAWGARIRQELLEVAGRDVTVSAIYVTLIRMEEVGLVRSREGERPERGGRPRRVFEVTAEGRERLIEARESMNRIWEGVDPGRAET